jgi:hypothetical protein
MKLGWILSVGALATCALAQETQCPMKAEGKKCCQSTEVKTVAKFEAGCCNQKGQAAKFKVFVANQGYQFFGCSESADQARKTLVASGKRVGAVQKVTGRVVI